MANYAELIQSIDAVIKSNNRREITGQILQNVLNQMVGSLGANYQLAGFAEPETDPQTPDQTLFYIATEAGNYTNFDNITLDDGLSFLMWKNSEWTAETIDIATHSWVEQNYVSKAFLRKMFIPRKADGTEITANDTLSVLDNIEAMVGLWTNKYLSALGLNPEGVGATKLSQLTDVEIDSETLTNGQALVYNSETDKWENGTIQGGTDMASVWAALAAETNEQINASHLSTALSGYVTSTSLATTLLDYVTSSALSTTLSTTLADYVTISALSTALEDYVSSSELATILEDYVTTSYLANTLSAYGTKQWIDENYVSISWFNNIFQVFKPSETAGEPDVQIIPNHWDVAASNIKAILGLWTEHYLSALGQSGDIGGGSSINPINMDDLTPINLFNVGDAIAYNGVIYRATEVTSNLPLTFVVQGEEFVVSNYKDLYAYVVADDTIQEGWEVWLDTGMQFYIENFQDRISQAERDIATLYSLVGGSGGGGGGGYFSPSLMWEYLASGTNEQINSTHLTSALYGYATQAWVSNQGFATQTWVTANFNKYVLPTATSEALGGIKVGFTTSAGDRNYAVQLSDGKAYVNVPWTDTTYSLPTATANTLGGIKIGYTETGKNYAVKLSSSKAYVYVPWSWRGMQNNLTTNTPQTEDSLSAYQGYLLANGNARDNTKLPLTGGTVTGSLTVQELLTANGGIVIPASKTLKIGEAIFEWDNSNNAVRIYKMVDSNEAAINFYTYGGVSALGYSGSSGGGGGGIALNPFEIEDIAVDTTFAENDVIALNGVIYRCTSATSNTPLTLVSQDNCFVYNELNGQKAFVVANNTLQSGWEVWIDTGVDYYIEYFLAATQKNERNIIALQEAVATMASQQWVKNQRYVTESFLRQQGFLTAASLDDYATKAWVNAKGYATEQWVSANFNNYSLPLAANGTRGGVQIGYTQAGKNYPVQLSGEKMYVNVPWTDTTYSFTNDNATLVWNTRVRVAVVGGTEIWVKLPANPDTWRGIQNNLNSTSTSDSLSAYQGYLLARGSARDDTKLPLAGGTLTGTLNVATGLGISDATGNGLLVYKPSGWTGVSGSQWGVGAVDIQGVIRSSDSALVHYRNGDNSYEIIDAKGGQKINNSLQVANIFLGHTNEINGYNGGVLYLQARNTGNTIININSGKCGIGVTSPQAKLHVGGDIYASGGVTGLVATTSDERKKNIISRELPLTLEQIADAPAVRFTWKDNEFIKGDQVGSIAQYWQDVLPEAVLEGNDEESTLSLQYGVAAMISAITTAREVVRLKKRVAELEKEVQLLKAA